MLLVQLCGCKQFGAMLSAMHQSDLNVSDVFSLAAPGEHDISAGILSAQLLTTN